MIDLTPVDVRKKKGDFRRAMRGYDPALVDDFLDQVADRMDELVRENMALSDRVTRQDQQVAEFRERERALTEALVTAQEMREEIRQQTSREAELVKKSAEQQAAQLAAATKHEVAQLRAAAEQEAAQLRSTAAQEATRLKAAAEQDAARLRGAAEQDAAQLRGAAERDATELHTTVRKERQREEEELRRLRIRQEQFLGSYRAFLERELSELSVLTRALGMGGDTASAEASVRAGAAAVAGAALGAGMAAAGRREEAAPVREEPPPAVAEPEPAVEEPELSGAPEVAAAAAEFEFETMTPPSAEEADLFVPEEDDVGLAPADEATVVDDILDDDFGFDDFEPEPPEPFAPEPFEPSDTADAADAAAAAGASGPWSEEEPSLDWPDQDAEPAAPAHDPVAEAVDQEIASLSADVGPTISPWGLVDEPAGTRAVARDEDETSLYDAIATDDSDDGVPGPIGLAAAAGDDGNDADDDEAARLLRNAAAAGYALPDDDELLLDDAILEADDEDPETDPEDDGWLPNLLEDER